jgi:uncharacterized protein
MPGQFTAPTTYFMQEGRENLPECLKLAFNAAKKQNITKILIFTSRGEGVRMALENFSSQADYQHIQIIAVTFPEGKAFTDAAGKPMRVEILPANQELFRDRGVLLVKAHLPFDPIVPVARQGGVLGQDLSLVGDALDILGGSMSLCVQAVLLACDSGAVMLGEHVIALTSDTAILAQAASTSRMFGELVIREVLCKPAILTISKKEIADRVPVQSELDAPGEQPKLGPAPVDAAVDAESGDHPDGEKN